MIPPQLTTFLLAMTPVGELRAAIPWGMTFGHLSSMEAFLFAVLGNILATILVIWLLPIVTKFARNHSKPLDKILQKIFAKTRKHHSKNFLHFEAFFLIILVAIPLPGSGSYTGSLVAWLFGVKPKIAIPLIATGIVLAGLIMLGFMNGMIAFAGSF